MAEKFGNRRQKAKERTRRVILDTAYALFEEKGYEKTTMRALAARAGVGLGTIFQHFSDKPSLLVAAFETDMEEVIQDSLKNLPDANLETRLLHLVRDIFGFYAQSPSLSRVLLREIMFLQGESQDRLDKTVLSFWKILAGLYKEAVERGELRSDIDVMVAVMGFWAAYTLVLIFGLRTPDFDVEGNLLLLSTLIDQHLNGLR